MNFKSVLIFLFVSFSLINAAQAKLVVGEEKNSYTNAIRLALNEVRSFKCENENKRNSSYLTSSDDIYHYFNRDLKRKIMTIDETGNQPIIQTQTLMPEGGSGFVHTTKFYTDTEYKKVTKIEYVESEMRDVNLGNLLQPNVKRIPVKINTVICEAVIEE